MLTRKKAKVLSDRLDRIANHVEKNFEVLGMSRKAAYDFCMYLDRTADHIEESAGLRQGETLQRENDEPYMDTFNFPKGPIETEADEPYMQEYKNDTDSQVVEDDDISPMNDGEWDVEASNWYDAGRQASNWYDAERTASNWYDQGTDEDWYL